MSWLRIAFIVPLVLFITGPAMARQVALVIGNNAYQHVEPLQKAVADADGYARMLRSKGYEVTLKQDLTHEQMGDALAAFADAISPGDTAVFVYSGHGWSDGTQNYLLGIDVPAQGSKEFLARRSISLKNGYDGVIDVMDQKGAALKVAIVDACRDNPFQPVAGQRGYSLARGLAPILPPSGTFVVFSAGAGQTALDRLSADDVDPNGVFTRVFLPLLAKDMNLLDSIKAAQQEVSFLARKVDHSQSPAYYDEVIGTACLRTACVSAPTRKPEALSVSSPEERMWSLLKNSNDVPTLSSFLDGLGEAAPERAPVEARLAELKKQRLAALPTPMWELLQPARKPTVQTDETTFKFGMELSTLRGNTAKESTLNRAIRGVVVLNVKQGSEASNLGLKEGDVIVSVNQAEVMDLNDFERQVDEVVLANKKAFMRVVRSGEERTVAVPEKNMSKEDAASLKKLKHVLIPAELSSPSPFSGVTALNLDPSDLKSHSLKAGVMVFSVKDKSTAAQIGIKRFDIIAEVNDVAISSTERLQQLLTERPSSWKLTILRDGEMLTTTIDSRLTE